jgi:uncharacterized protein YdcH (DUF465 family)
MAQARELDHPVSIQDSEDSTMSGADGAPLSQDNPASTQPRAEGGLVNSLEQQAGSFTDAAGRISRIAEEIETLNGRIARLEGRSQTQSGSADGAELDGSQLAEKVRQLDDRLQTIANLLAEQNWSRR